MPTNYFFTFAPTPTGDPNKYPIGDWEVEPVRLTGNLPGTDADNKAVNSALFQNSQMVSALGKSILDVLGVDATPDTTVDNLASLLLSTFKTHVGDAAPVGSIQHFPALNGTATLNAQGYILADGSLVARDSYPLLWEFAQNHGIIISDVTWSNNNMQKGLYSSGNGSTTFRLPKLIDTVFYHGESYTGAWNYIDTGGLKSGETITATVSGSTTQNISTTIDAKMVEVVYDPPPPLVCGFLGMSAGTLTEVENGGGTTGDFVERNGALVYGGPNALYSAVYTDSLRTQLTTLGINPDVFTAVSTLDIPSMLTKITFKTGGTRTNTIGKNVSIYPMIKYK